MPTYLMQHSGANTYRLDVLAMQQELRFDSTLLMCGTSAALWSTRHVTPSPHLYADRKVSCPSSLSSATLRASTL
jgi:hypothetical protein